MSPLSFQQVPIFKIRGRRGTVAHHGSLLGLESTYMKEAPKSAGIVCKIASIDLFIDNHPGETLPHFYVKNIFLAQILAEFHWQPS